MPNDAKLCPASRAFVMMVLATSLGVATEAQAQNLPPLATHLNPSETALILVDYQYPFTNPAGDSYVVVKKDIEGGMLDRTVQLVKKARELGVWVIHVTEGYTGDYRELDPTNPGGFHRFGILAQAFKTGTPKAPTARGSRRTPSVRYVAVAHHPSAVGPAMTPTTARSSQVVMTDA